MLPPSQIKYELSRNIPTRVRNAVLDSFQVWGTPAGDGYVIRLSYYHLKAHTTANCQGMISQVELESRIGHKHVLRFIAKQLMQQVRSVVKELAVPAGIESH